MPNLMSMLIDMIFLCSVLGIICWIGERSTYYSKEELELIKQLKERNIPIK